MMHLRLLCLKLLNAEIDYLRRGLFRSLFDVEGARREGLELFMRVALE